MDDKSKKGIISVLSLALGLFVPIFLKIRLDAPISVGVISLMVLLVTGLGIAWRLWGDSYRWLKHLSAGVAAIGGLVTLVGIVITPLSAYVEWFDSFRSGVPHGGVSNIFVLVGGFFSAIISPMMLTTGILWPLIVIGFVLLYLLTVIMQTQLHLLTLIAFLAAAMVFYTYRLVSGRVRGSSLVFSVSLIVVSLIGAAVFPPLENPAGSDYVNDTLHPELRQAVAANFPRFPLLYAVPGYGIQFDERQLGGTPTLTEDPLFTIRGTPGDVVYVKTRVFDAYDGSSWAMSPYLATERFDADRGPLFSRSADVPEDAIEITLTARRFGFVPYTVNTNRVYIPEVYPDIESGSIDTGYKLRTPLERGQTVYLEQRSADERGPVKALDERERALYMQIPEDLPEDLRFIADGLSSELGTDREVLTNIERFLAENYSYDLNVDEFMMEPSGDFVYSFLFSATSGYCVQFATSFIILARLSGIPARYATGYLSYIPESGELGNVTGLSSHAWPEVWLDDLGWVNWEATPAANLSNYTQFGDGWVFNFGTEFGADTSRQIEGLLGRRVAADASELEESGSREAWAGWRYVGLAVPALAGLLALVLAVAHGVPALLYSIKDERGRFYHRLQTLTRRLKRHGVPDPKLVGWLRWSDELVHRVRETRPEVDQVRQMVLRSTYGDGMFESGYVNTIAELSKQIRKDLRQSSNHH